MTAFPPIAEIRTGILPDCDAVRSKGRAGGAPERTSARQDSPGGYRGALSWMSRASLIFGTDPMDLEPRCSPMNSLRASFSSTASSALGGAGALLSAGISPGYFAFRRSPVERSLPGNGDNATPCRLGSFC
jgi:hypothetical protein